MNKDAAAQLCTTLIELDHGFLVSRTMKEEEEVYTVEFSIATLSNVQLSVPVEFCADHSITMTIRSTGADKIRAVFV